MINYCKIKKPQGKLKLARFSHRRETVIDNNYSYHPCNSLINKILNFMIRKNNGFLRNCAKEGIKQRLG